MMARRRIAIKSVAGSDFGEQTLIDEALEGAETDLQHQLGEVIMLDEDGRSRGHAFLQSIIDDFLCQQVLGCILIGRKRILGNVEEVTVVGLNITDADRYFAEKVHPHISKRERSHIDGDYVLLEKARGAGSVSWREQSYDTNFTGTSADYLTVEGGELEEGRFFTKEEVDGIARVVVLGSTVREEIFGQTNPVGQTVRLKNTTFTVVGLMKERGTVAFQNYDDQILLPVTSMQKLIAGVHHLGLLRLKVDASENIDQTIADVEQTLRERHGITDQSGESDDFSVRSSRDGIEALQTITGGLSFFLAAMAALSLLVGGIGIMNIMLIRVVERTREIGLRQAVGARRFDIMAQFLTEAIAITLSGGVIGIIIGEIVSSVLTLVARQLGYEWPFSFSPLAISLAVCVSMAIGLIFGLYPAAKASKLDPIEALRYE
jgi:hypothetical protein